MIKPLLTMMSRKKNGDVPLPPWATWMSDSELLMRCYPGDRPQMAG